MDHNYYKISDIYKKDVVLKEFTGNPASVDSKNSYQTTASMMGPGHGPSNASDSQMAVNGNQVTFPNEQELSNYQKAELLIKFFKRELDEGNWDQKTNNLFQKLISYFLELDSDEEEEDMDEPELK